MSTNWSRPGSIPVFRFVQDFYSFHGTSRQTFAKYYNRFLLSPSDDSFLPRKRGPRWKSRRTIPLIEQKIINERFNRYQPLRDLCHTQTHP